jgi:hypothetical protein
VTSVCVSGFEPQRQLPLSVIKTLMCDAECVVTIPVLGRLYSLKCVRCVRIMVRVPECVVVLQATFITSIINKERFEPNTLTVLFKFFSYS